MQILSVATIYTSGATCYFISFSKWKSWKKSHTLFCNQPLSSTYRAREGKNYVNTKYVHKFLSKK